MQYQEYNTARSQEKDVAFQSADSIPILATCMSDVFVTLGVNMLNFIEILKDPHDVVCFI
jgi:hypothetical protein